MDGSLKQVKQVDKKKMVIDVRCTALYLIARIVKIFRIPSPAVKIRPGQTEVAVPGLL